MHLQGLVPIAQCDLVGPGREGLEQPQNREVLEMNGLSRVFTILRYPVKLNEKYVYPHNRGRCEQPALQNHLQVPK